MSTTNNFRPLIAVHLTKAKIIELIKESFTYAGLETFKPICTEYLAIQQPDNELYLLLGLKQNYYINFYDKEQRLYSTVIINLDLDPNNNIVYVIGETERIKDTDLRSQAIGFLSEPSQTFDEFLNSPSVKEKPLIGRVVITTE